MDAIGLASNQIDVENAKNLIYEYWIIPAGLIALFFYGRFHFNTPAYALSTNTSEVEGELIRNLPMSRIRGLAPPIFTTTRSQYHRCMIRYVLILQSAFLIVTCVPDILISTIGIVAQKLQPLLPYLSDSMQQRAIFSLFALTGFLSAFPGVRDVDKWILGTLHKSAAIPENAEQTAEILYETEYTPDQGIKSELLRSATNGSFIQVLNGQMTGSFENEWILLRTLGMSAKRMMASSGNSLLGQVLRNDVDDIENATLVLRHRVLQFMDKQAAIMPDGAHRFDDIYQASRSDEIRSLEIIRNRLRVETQALYFRLCRFFTLAVFATEASPQGISRILNGIGFQVEVEAPPRVQWWAIAQVGLAVAIAVFIPTALFGVIAKLHDLQMPNGLSVYIPSTPAEAVSWSAMAASLHVGAVILSVRYKVQDGSTALNDKTENRTNNIVVVALTYFVSAVWQIVFMMLYRMPLLGTLLWATWPAITSAFVCKYIDRSRIGKQFSYRRIARQAAFMVGAGVIASFAIVVPDFDIRQVSPGAWAFMIYAAVCAASIGFAVGQAFQRCYSHDLGNIVSVVGVVRSRNRRIIEDIRTSQADLQSA